MTSQITETAVPSVASAVACLSRHPTRRFKALQNDPVLLFLRPATAEFDDGEVV